MGDLIQTDGIAVHGGEEGVDDEEDVVGQRCTE